MLSVARKPLPLFVLLLLACACEPQAGGSVTPTDGPEPGVPCAGATLEEARAKSHPAILRGVVRAPKTQTAGISLIKSAHAYALDFEKPVADAEVTLSAVGVSKALVSTRTDQEGRWCVRIPAGYALGPAMTLSAQKGSLRLRHIAAFPFDTEISAMTEALVRVLVSARVDRAALRSADVLNVRTLSDTAIGLMSGMDIESRRDVNVLIGEMEASLKADARVQAWLKKSPQSSSHE